MFIAIHIPFSELTCAFLDNYMIQTTLRLSWMIQNNKKLQMAIEQKNALFGTLDSWLLYRLRQGNDLDIRPEHISDVTSCSATGFYDPFTLQWAKWALNLFSIKVKENFYSFLCIKSPKSDVLFILFDLGKYAANCCR